jgi:hypothetical protein
MDFLHILHRPFASPKKNGKSKKKGQGEKTSGVYERNVGCERSVVITANQLPAKI